MKTLKRFAGTLLMLLAINAQAALFQIPDAPKLNDAGTALITEFEGCDLSPSWARGASGVDIGYGYDAGYYSKSVILHDWSLIPEQERQAFADTSGVTGSKAAALAAALRWIRIHERDAAEVFQNVDVPREYDRCKRAFPGFEILSTNAQAALISLGYNRGYSMVGDSRREMRIIRALCPIQDYTGMAEQIRIMTRLWLGTSIEQGMKRRRNAEADLMIRP